MKEYVLETFTGKYNVSGLSSAFQVDDESVTQALNDYARKGFILESLHRDYPSLGESVVIITTLLFSKEQEL